MICQNCQNEISNLDRCPYCGADHETMPVFAERTGSVREDHPEFTRRDRKHLANLDTWGLLCVVLLAALFVLELLRLIYAVIV